MTAGKQREFLAVFTEHNAAQVIIPFQEFDSAKEAVSYKRSQEEAHPEANVTIQHGFHEPRSWAEIVAESPTLRVVAGPHTKIVWK